MQSIARILVLILFAQTAHAEAQRGSLFAGKSENGLFADRPVQVSLFANPTTLGLAESDVQIIRSIIQEAESRKDGYDAVQHGARIKPNKRPTQMTIAQIFVWIDATPGQPHAIGLYQFIPETLRRVVRETGISPSQRFSPQVQDQLADVLLSEAGLHKFRDGKLTPQRFMDNLAKIWAGLPNSTGKSHYEGYAGNKATISLARFQAILAQISPKSG